MAKAYIEKEIREDYRKLTERLIARGITITTMESCTSGQVASLITDTEGASAILRGAYVTYSNMAKILCGVPEETISRYTVYSEETACAMADACRARMQADIGVGVTGTMGNTDPANAAASTPGEVYFAISTKDGTTPYHLSMPAQPTRLAYKLAVAKEIADVLTEII